MNLGSLAENFICWICGLSKLWSCIAQKTAELTKQECLYCNRAVGALDRAADSQGKNAKLKLQNLRKYEQKEYNTQVLRMRIAPKDEPAIEVQGC